MAWSDFNWVHIDHSFTINSPTTTVEFPIAGDPEWAGQPIDDAFILVQALGVSSNAHRIRVNNQHLPGIDIPAHPGWQTWMDRVPPGILVRGTNSISIDRVGNDDFYVYGVTVNWREENRHQVARSDFNVVRINQEFDNNSPTVTVEFPIEGVGEAGGSPVDDAFILIQGRDVSSESHQIRINDQHLGGLDIPAHKWHQTWMDRIQSGLLHKGTNTIRIDRIGADNFFIGDVVVNWRESVGEGQGAHNSVFSDFNWVPIKHTLNVNAPTVTVDFPIEKLDLEPLETVADDPIDDAYLLLQARDVSTNSHRIYVNNKRLPDMALPAHHDWQTWMERIPPGMLRVGTNTLRIDKIGGDSLHIEAAVVNWREKSGRIVLPSATDQR